VRPGKEAVVQQPAVSASLWALREHGLHSALTEYWHANHPVMTDMGGKDSIPALGGSTLSGEGPSVGKPAHPTLSLGYRVYDQSHKLLARGHAALRNMGSGA
jgi:hypothetical protein